MAFCHFAAHEKAKVFPGVSWSREYDPHTFVMLSPAPEPDERSFAFLADLVYRRSRIRLGADKRAFLAGRLASRLRNLGLSNYGDYCRLLATGNVDEAERLVDLISTNHTGFFREPAHFEFLARELLPDLTRRALAASRPLAVWCAAAASGEEPYSLAIVLAEHERTNATAGWSITASDISRRMLDRCRQGIYEADKVRLPDQSWLHRYFRRGFGEREGLYRVKPELRQRVRTMAINLFQSEYPVAAGLDVIFCRNVMIYFDEASRQTLVEQLFDQLAPGGSLFVGHAESLLGLRHRFRQVRPAVYERPA
jgi:chemotaxis protein methyltransferase CheR